MKIDSPVVRLMIRPTGAALAAIAAVGWIIERSSGNANFVTVYITNVYPHALSFNIILATASVIAYVWHHYSIRGKLLKTTDQAV